MPNEAGFAPQNDVFRSAVERQLAIAYDDHHALPQMKKRGIWRQDVWQALATGHVVGTEIAYEDEERWRIVGENTDGFPLIVVIRAIAPDDDVVYVITAFEPK